MYKIKTNDPAISPVSLWGRLSNKPQLASMKTLLLFFLALNVSAQTKVVVVPLGGDDFSPLANVVTVSREDGDFSDPMQAVDSINDATAENPYLIVIGPGVYDIGSNQITMKEFVNIAGSGRSTTIIRTQRDRTTGSLSIGAVLVGASNTELRDLTLENLNGANNSTLGIYNSGTQSQQINNVRIAVEADTAGQAWGIYNASGASPTVSNSRIEVSGTQFDNRGIENLGASQTRILNTEIVIVGDSGGIELSQAMINRNNSNIELNGVRIDITEAQGGFSAIENTNTSVAIVRDSTITIDDGVGIENSTSTARALVYDSEIRAPNDSSIVASTGSGANETYISNTLIDGSIQGDPKCSFVFDVDGTALDGDCDPPGP